MGCGASGEAAVKGAEATATEAVAERKAQVANLAGKGASELQAELDKAKDDVDVLDISANTLSELPPGLGRLKQLDELNCSENKIKSIDVVCSLTRLTSLDISDNEIGALPAEIGNLTELTKLLAFKNSLSALDPAVFKCTKLEEANFFNNKIIRVPEDMKNWTNMLDLNLSSNKLKQLPPNSLDGMTKLKRLAAFWNSLMKLASFKDLVSLEQLQLNDNMIMALPEFAPCHPQLKEVILNKNDLPTLGDAFTPERFPALEALEVAQNKLTEVPPQLGTLPNLTKLALGNNTLTSIPDSIWTCTNLTFLGLSANVGIMVLPDGVGNLTKLETLYIDGTGITQLPGPLKKCLDLVRFNIKGLKVEKGDVYDEVKRNVQAHGGKAKFLE